MTDEQNERAALASEARLDAKAFRENTVYDSGGDPIRLIANANRLDQYAYRIEVLEAENAWLREALHTLSKIDNWIAGKPAGAGEVVEYVEEVARAALKDTRNDADA